MNSISTSASPSSSGQTQQIQTTIIEIDGVQGIAYSNNDIVMVTTDMRAESEIHSWTTKLFLKAYAMKHGCMVPDSRSALPVFINSLLTSIEMTLLKMGFLYGKVGKNGNTIPLHPTPRNLPPVSVALIAASSGRFIRMKDEAGTDMMMFQFRGGLLDKLWRSFSLSDQSIAETEALAFIEQFNSSLKQSQKKDIFSMIRTNVKFVENQVNNADMIPFRNGVFVYETDFTGKLIPWDDVPDNWIFKYKIPYDFQNVPFLAEPQITEPDGSIWTPLQCIQDLFDDTEHAAALFEIMAAALRPTRIWDRAAIFLDGNRSSGANGKSMMISLFARFLGDEVPELKIGQVKALDMENLGQRFALMGAENASLIISHENVKEISDKSLSIFKTIIKGDAVSMDRKNQAPITIRLKMFSIFAFNNLPLLGDKGGAVERRLATLIFPHCFTGKEKTYIDKDYLHRKEVIEYYLWYLVTKVGRMPDGLPDHVFYHTDTKQFMAKSDPVISFMKHLHDNKVLEGDDAPTVISRDDMYTLYCMYYMQEYNTTVIPKMSYSEFSSRLANAVKDDPTWKFAENPRDSRKNDRIPFDTLHMNLGKNSRANAMYRFAYATQLGLYRYMIAVNKETSRYRNYFENGNLSPDNCVSFLGHFLSGWYADSQRNCIYRKFTK